MDQVSRGTLHCRPQVTLLDGFGVRNGRARGEPVPGELPRTVQRLVAHVCLAGRPARAAVAGRLWPEVPEAKAEASLRSALWRLRGADIDLLVVDKVSLRLRDDVAVDVELAGEWASRVVSGTSPPEEPTVLPAWLEALELLPGWYDDWVIMERERLRQRMLHALEALSHRLVAVGRFAEAVDAAMTAVAVEPLRESAQRALVTAHLAEGNRVEGRRCFDSYRELLRRDLSVEPAADLVALVYPRGVRTGQAPQPLRLAPPPAARW